MTSWSPQTGSKSTTPPPPRAGPGLQLPILITARLRYREQQAKPLPRTPAGGKRASTPTVCVHSNTNRSRLPQVTRDGPQITSRSAGKARIGLSRLSKLSRLQAPRAADPL